MSIFVEMAKEEEAKERESERELRKIFVLALINKIILINDKIRQRSALEKSATINTNLYVDRFDGYTAAHIHK